MSTVNDRFQSVYSQLWDVVVFGGGYAGYAAANKLLHDGKKVLLIDRTATPLWESAWACAGDVGISQSPEWVKFHQSLASRSAAGEGWVDGAIAQVVACHEIQQRKLPTLFYATPVAARTDSTGLLSSVTVVAKSELRVLTARQWIDTTEAGELLAILPRSNWQAPVSDHGIIRIFYRHKAWADDNKPVEFTTEKLPGSKLVFAPSPWINERILSYNIPADTPYPRLTWVPALQAAQDKFGDVLTASVVTHCSLIPMPVYSRSNPQPELPGNIINAVPGSVDPARANTLAGRFEIGLKACDQINSAKSSQVVDIQATPDTPVYARKITTDVVVAGIGTGGAVAAIAAAREGAKTVAFDPLPFPGGIGTGGGIHSYYFGVKGGMQDELDLRTREAMNLFGTVAQVSGFHPDAKKVALDQMLADASVIVLTGATLFDTRIDADGRILSASVSTENGAIEITARAWIDGTGDADLAAAAGAQFALGRTGDGQIHAFSQSSGRASVRDDRARMNVINYDAGFVDPTDAQDLTRARLLSTAHYIQEQYTDIERPTYIAPALGLRQGRQVATDYVITLADLIEKRHFDDSIGLTGCHYDNHAIDYEFESDEAMFWVWCCRQWRSGRTGGHMPYRMMLPIGIANLWVACRGAGISEEAHHSLRMQRDFQRLGEAAGYAAALTTRDGQNGESRKVPMQELRHRLIQTGAMAETGAADTDSFGHSTGASDCKTLDGDLLKWLDETKVGPCIGMYRLMRHGKNAPEMSVQLRKWLDSDHAGQSFRAASILAVWGDPACEPRLINAIQTREEGYDESDAQRPENFQRLAPHWLVAIRLLRACGTPACFDAFEKISQDTSLLHNARTSLAITLESIAARHTLTPHQKSQVTAILRKLLDSPVPNAVGLPQRKVVDREQPSPVPPTPQSRQPVIEDFSWQLHLAIAKAEQAVGTKVHDQAATFLSDPRATVRKSFSQILQSY